MTTSLLLQEQAVFNAAATGDLKLLKLALGTKLEKDQKTRYVAMQTLHAERFHLMLKSEILNLRHKALLELEEKGQLSLAKEKAIANINHAFLQTDSKAKENITNLIKEYLAQTKSYYDDNEELVLVVDVTHKEANPNTRLLADSMQTFINRCLGNFTQPASEKLLLNNHRLGLFNETLQDKAMSEKLSETLAEGWSVGKAHGEGDCFFDAFAQGLAQATAHHYTVKQLREICHQYAMKLDKGEKAHNWIYQSYLQHVPQDVTHPEDIANKHYLDYLTHIQYIAAEYQQGLAVKRNEALWGEQHLDARILCAHFKVKLHVVEIHGAHPESTEEGSVAHQLITGDGSQSIDSIDFNAENCIHIAVYNNHYVPLLLKTTLQQQEATSLQTFAQTSETTDNDSASIKNQGLGITDQAYLEKGQFLALVSFYDNERLKISMQAEIIFEKIQKLQDDIGACHDKTRQAQQERHVILTKETSQLPACYQQLDEATTFQVLHRFMPINIQEAQTGNTLLHTAISHKKFSVVKFLTEQGLDVLKSNKENKTPLSLALSSNDTPIIETVLLALREQPIAQTHAGKNQDAMKELLIAKQILLDYGAILEKRKKTSNLWLSLNKAWLKIRGQLRHLEARCQEYERYWVSLKAANDLHAPHLLDIEINKYLGRTDNRGFLNKSVLHDRMAKYQREFNKKYSPALFIQNRDERLLYAQKQDYDRLERDKNNLALIKTQNEAVYDKEMQELTLKVVERDNIITQQKGTITEKKVEIDQKNNKISEQKDTITEQKKTINEKDNTITEQKTTLNEKDKTIIEQETTINQKDSKIIELYSKINTLESNMALIMAQLGIKSGYSTVEPTHSTAEEAQSTIASPRP